MDSKHITLSGIATIMGIFSFFMVVENMRNRQTLTETWKVASNAMVYDQALKLTQTSTQPPLPINWKVVRVEVSYYWAIVTLVETSEGLDLQKTIQLDIARTHWFFHEFASLQPKQIVQLVGVGLHDKSHADTPVSYLGPECPVLRHYLDLDQKSEFSEH